jgi:2-polyprenyl-3-methyl-5-hydroxy-6-metoxy-1,4-benzoquinol methylase
VDLSPGKGSMAFYKIDFACDDGEELQSKLNFLYDYKDDVCTKVLHRNRLNLFCLLTANLIKGRVIESFDSAIDIGCNAGVYSKIISDLGFKHVLGIDISSEAIRRANESFAFADGERTLEYKILDAENMDTTRKVDFVLCTEVIEHATRPGRVIQNVKDLLAPGGVAIITLPNRISFAYLTFLLSLKLKSRPIDESIRQHLNYPFYKSIQLFRDKGLRIVKISGTNLVLDGVLLRLFYPTGIFSVVNRMDFHISRRWPLFYLTQFLFIALKNEGRAAPCP